MAPGSDKVSIHLDAEIVERTRSAVGGNEEDDDAVVEHALTTFLGGQTLDTFQAPADRTEDVAEPAVYEDVRAASREGGADVREHERDFPRPTISASDLVRVMRRRNAVHRARVEHRLASLRRIAEELRRAAR